MQPWVHKCVVSELRLDDKVNCNEQLQPLFKGFGQVHGLKLGNICKMEIFQSTISNNLNGATRIQII